jgi:hypothetical protein
VHHENHRGTGRLLATMRILALVGCGGHSKESALTTTSTTTMTSPPPTATTTAEEPGQRHDRGGTNPDHQPVEDPGHQAMLGQPGGDLVPAMISSATRNAKYWFPVDQARTFAARNA